MAQSFRVVRCYQCETFQVDIEKKSSKWQCKICQEKQSLKQVYHRGPGAECRKAVQQLNLQRRDEVVRQEERVSNRLEEQNLYMQEEQNLYRQEERVSLRKEERDSFGQEEQNLYRQEEQNPYRQEQISYGQEEPLREIQLPTPAAGHRAPVPPAAKTSRWAKFLPPETRYSDEEEDEEDFRVPQLPKKVPQLPKKVPQLPKKVPQVPGKRKSSEEAGLKVAGGGPGKWGRFQP